MNKKNDNDQPTAVLSILIIISVGYGFLLFMPCLVGGMVDRLGFSPKQAGWVAFAQMFGMMVGALSSSRLLLYSPIQVPMYFFSGLLVVTEIISTLAGTPGSLAGIRGLSGVCAGLTTGMAMSTISGMHRPERIFSLLLIAQFSLGAAGLAIIPHILSKFKMAGVFHSMAALSLIAFVSVTKIPALHLNKQNSPKPDYQKPILPISLILCSLFILYSSNNMLWAYLDRIGVSAGLSANVTGLILGLSMLSGIIGGTLAFLIEAKISRLFSIGFGMAGMILGASLLLNEFGKIAFLLSASLLNGCLSFTVVYFLGFLTDFDETGVLLSVSNFTIISGMTIGPLLGIAFLDESGYTTILKSSIIGFIFCLFLIESAVFIADPSQPAENMIERNK